MMTQTNYFHSRFFFKPSGIILILTAIGNSYCYWFHSLDSFELCLTEHLLQRIEIRCYNIDRSLRDFVTFSTQSMSLLHTLSLFKLFRLLRLQPTAPWYTTP